ncbi:cytochrome P450 [Cladorrhinum sp. PSN332]|nr:cytochrome P450 [Cladorrhinum sp. PSN332]
MIIEILSSISTWILIAAVSFTYLLYSKQRPIFPIINDYPGDFFRRKAYREYKQNAKKLLADGFTKHRGPVTVLIPNGSKIVLPSSLSDWVKTNRDLDHQELVREEYFAGYPGFEALDATHSRDGMLIDVLRAKLSQHEGAAVLPIVNEHVAAALEEYWGAEGHSWHTVDWDRDTTGLISRAAASVFVGPEKAADREWQRIVQTYVREFFAAVGELHGWPAMLRPFVQWFLPHASACRVLVKEARVVVRKVVRQRAQEAAAAREQGLEPRRHDDALTWTQDAQRQLHNTIEPGDIQLALAMSALFTTTEALKQILIDVGKHPELVDPLRHEVTQSLSEYGLGLEALAKMELLDSVMKESQRQLPALVGLERKAIRDTTLPDGTRIPKGSHIAVDSSEMWSPEVHENPDSHDGYRFLKRRQAGDKSAQFVQSSREHHIFGGGRHICPGRFFANNELKLCLVHILTKYDIRLKDGYQSPPMSFGFFAIADPMVQLEVRRRGGGDTGIGL